MSLYRHLQVKQLALIFGTKKDIVVTWTKAVVMAWTGCDPSGTPAPQNRHFHRYLLTTEVFKSHFKSQLSTKCFLLDRLLSISEALTSIPFKLSFSDQSGKNQDDFADIGNPNPCPVLPSHSCFSWQKYLFSAYLYCPVPAFLIQALHSCPRQFCISLASVSTTCS